jgi:hypothetical protein
LTIAGIPRPLVDFQAATLTDQAAVPKLIRRISTLCGQSAPPLYSAEVFCENIESMTKPHSTFSDMQSVGRAMSLQKVPLPEIISRSSIDVEPQQLVVQVLQNQTLSITGETRDAGIVTIPFLCSGVPDFLVIEVENAENIRKCFFDQMLKVVINSEPIEAFFAFQRHPLDSQYVSKQNGFVVYSLKDVATDREFILKLVLWRMSVEHLRIRFYFVEPEMIRPDGGTKNSIPGHSGSLR